MQDALLPQKDESGVGNYPIWTMFYVKDRYQRTNCNAKESGKNIRGNIGLFFHEILHNQQRK